MASGVSRTWAALVLQCVGGMAAAHDPVFGLGPHTLFRGGIELHAGYFREKQGAELEREYGLALKYGLTADWTAGVELPFVDLSAPGQSRSGRGNIGLSTKYRFWRNDQPGAQEAAATSLGVVVGGTGASHIAGDGGTDVVAGLSYGYEGRKWYRWAAVRYRMNGENDDSRVDRGDALLADVVIGIRPRPYGYREADWVWMLELNAEHTGQAKRDGRALPATGGYRLFVSPGLMWTYRNYAIKVGAQIPALQDLNGDQRETDFRFNFELEGHF